MDFDARDPIEDAYGRDVRDDTNFHEEEAEDRSVSLLGMGTFDQMNTMSWTLRESSFDNQPQEPAKGAGMKNRATTENRTRDKYSNPAPSESKNAGKQSPPSQLPSKNSTRRRQDAPTKKESRGRSRPSTPVGFFRRHFFAGNDKSNKTRSASVQPRAKSRTRRRKSDSNKRSKSQPHSKSKNLHRPIASKKEEQTSADDNSSGRSSGRRVSAIDAVFRRMKNSKQGQLAAKAASKAKHKKSKQATTNDQKRKQRSRKRGKSRDRSVPPPIVDNKDSESVGEADRSRYAAPADTKEDDGAWLIMDSPSQCDGSLTDSMSEFNGEVEDDEHDEIDDQSEGESTVETDDSSVRNGVNENYKKRYWKEIKSAASIIAKRFHREAPQDYEFENAVHLFKRHAARLKMGERELYAVVRNDPDILNDSDDDADTIYDVFNILGKALEDSLDHYASAFQKTFRCASSEDSEMESLMASRVSAE